MLREVNFTFGSPSTCSAAGIPRVLPEKFLPSVNGSLAGGQTRAAQVIEATGLTKRYGDETAYRAIAVSLREVGALPESRSVHTGRSARNHLLTLAATIGVSTSRRARSRRSCRRCRGCG